MNYIEGLSHSTIKPSAACGSYVQMSNAIKQGLTLYGHIKTAEQWATQ